MRSADRIRGIRFPENMYALNIYWFLRGVFYASSFQFVILFALYYSVLQGFHMAMSL